MGSDWISRPIRLVSNQEIFFEPGVVGVAKKGEFRGRRDKFFMAKRKKNITITGYDATIRMQKKDYMGPDYRKLEYRHALAFFACTDVKVAGLTLRDSGGDGIYIGSLGKTPCKNVEIRDCICDNNYRQGLSIISVENLLVENCVFKNTNGTPPSAGIDIEPNSPSDRLSNVVIKNCISLNNAGSGLTVYLRKLSRRSEPISIRFLARASLAMGTSGLTIFPITPCSVRPINRAGAKSVTVSGPKTLLITNTGPCNTTE